MNSIHTFWGTFSGNPLDGTIEHTDQKAVLEGTDQSAVLEKAEHVEQRSTFAIIESRQDLGAIDEIRVNETAKIMADVFSEHVITNWSEMSVEERSAKINEYYIRAGENLGIHTKGVIVEPMHSPPGRISFGLNGGDGYIHLNRAVVADPNMLGQVLDTATHEMRHQFQNDVLMNPNAFPDISDETRAQWQYEMTHYISPDYDYKGYYEQAIECDARNYAESVMNSYIQKIHLS